MKIEITFNLCLVSMKLSLQKYVFQNKITNMEYIGKRVLNHVNSDSTITIITDGSPA